MDGTLFEEISGLAKQHRRSTAKEIEMAVADYVARRTRAFPDNPNDTRSRYDFSLEQATRYGVDVDES